MTSDEQLIKKLLAGDRLAVRSFYNEYAPCLLRFIRRKVGNEQDVEEIAQDSLFAFLEGIRDFTGVASLNTYLCSIASHKIADFYRRKKFVRIVFSQLPDGFESLISELADPQKSFDNTLLRQKIASIFSRLAPRTAEIIKLKYIEGKSVVEIAKTFAISLKAAESRLFRARKAFVKLYAS